MFIIVTGTRCAGKTTFSEHLVTKKAFTVLRLASTFASCSSTVLDISNPQSLVKEFVVPRDLLNYVTLHWQENFVTEDIQDKETLDVFARRPFVLVVTTDAPMLVRYRRHKKMHEGKTAGALKLEDFVALHDQLVYGDRNIVSSALNALTPTRHLHILNPYENIEEFHASLEKLDVMNPDRLRPSWDTYFMTLASLASMRSNCMKRRVGALLVKDHRIVSTGYNGTPRGLKNCKDGGCSRCNNPQSEAFDECLCLHAEENALLEAGRERVDPGAGSGTVLYCNTCPCLRCTIKIIQTGVKEVVYNFSYKMDRESARLFTEAGVKLRQYSLP